MQTNSNTVESAQGLGKSLLEISRLHQILALVNSKGDLTTMTGSTLILRDNPQLLMLLTTSLAVAITCLLLLIWRRSGSSVSKSPEKPTPLVSEKEPETEDDVGKKKVTVFFGTQTGSRTPKKKESRARSSKGRIDEAAKSDVEARIPFCVQVELRGRFVVPCHGGDHSQEYCYELQKICLVPPRTSKPSSYDDFASIHLKPP